MNSSFKRMEKRAAEAKARSEKPKVNDDEIGLDANISLAEKQMCLPLELLGHGARGAPDSVLRSALFAANRPGKRRHLDNEKVASVSNIEIRQTGPQLQQIDLDVWIELIRIAAEVQGSTIQIPLRTLLKRLNRDTGVKSRDRVISTLRRLNATLVGITHGKSDYDGTLIFDHARDENNHLVIQLNPRVAKLFDRSSWSNLQLEQRHSLKRQPLAQWLHGYYSSHKNPYPIKLETLRSLCGSNTRGLNHFRAEVRSAMEKVEDTTGWKWSIDKTDKLVVVKGQS